MTKKELIEKGYIDQYVLGLTSEEESAEVERLASLYPEIQDQINSTRTRICSKFNRDLTQPAMASSFLTKKRVMIFSGLIVAFFSISFGFLYREHFSLQEDYSTQCEKLAREEAKVMQLASFNKLAIEQSNFLNATDTRRIKLNGFRDFPEAEVMIFHSTHTGKMMLRVIDLPDLVNDHHFEVWAQRPNKEELLLGALASPVRFDSLYLLNPLFDFTALHIKMIDPATSVSMPVCMHTAHKL